MGSHETVFCAGLCCHPRILEEGSIRRWSLVIGFDMLRMITSCSVFRQTCQDLCSTLSDIWVSNVSTHVQSRKFIVSLLAMLAQAIRAAASLTNKGHARCLM